MREQQRQAAQRLLNRICARMQARARKDTLEEAHEDPTTIKSYFRTTSSTKATTNDSECAIDLVEHEINLHKYGIKGYKCTLIFNKSLKVGAGTRDRLKKNTKLLAYEELKSLTRKTPKENLVLKKTRDGFWNVAIKVMNKK
ncbi:unnamed protein product [Rotaria sp. Silwood2]|nr:unnamed protein product [Rotaria sp. Silwood2]